MACLMIATHHRIFQLTGARPVLVVAAGLLSRKAKPACLRSVVLLEFAQLRLIGSSREEATALLVMPNLTVASGPTPDSQQRDSAHVRYMAIPKETGIGSHLHPALDPLAPKSHPERNFDMMPKQLSKADSKVLAQVLDPEGAPSNAVIVIDPRLPEDRCIQNAELLRHIKVIEKAAVTSIEEFEKSKQPEARKEQAYRAALSVLDDLITAHPLYASARNNRAQLRRWRFGDRGLLCQKTTQVNVDRKAAGGAVFEDLETAISLASPARPQDAVSPGQGRLLAQAYTQLGALYYAAFRDCDTADVQEVVKLDGGGWNRERFEEEASRAFYVGGLYGSEVAQALAVRTNPHAKLCGSIVKEAMRKEFAVAQ